MSKWGLFVLLTAIPAQVSAYLGGALRTHNHSSINQGGTLGDVTATTATITNRLTASSGVFTGGWGVANTYGGVLVSSGELVAISTSNNAGSSIFRIYGASGNVIGEFNQNGASDIQQVFRIFNSAQASVLTITGAGGISANGSLGVKGITNTVNNLTNTSGANFTGQLTVAVGSVSVPNNGIWAASGTFTNGVTASSGSFTQTSTYSIVSSSGLYIKAGTIDLSLSPSNGIRFNDGSVQTAAPSAAYTENRSSSVWTLGDTSFSNTAPAGCTATSTTTLTVRSATSQGVECDVSIGGWGSSANQGPYYTVYRDAVNFPTNAPASNAAAAQIVNNSQVANFNTSAHFKVWFPPMSAAAHSFCVGQWVNAGTGHTLCDGAANPLTNMNCRIVCREIP